MRIDERQWEGMKSRSYIEKIDFKDGFPERKIEQNIILLKCLERQIVKVSTSVTEFFPSCRKRSHLLKWWNWLDLGFRKKLIMNGEIIGTNRQTEN